MVHLTFNSRQDIENLATTIQFIFYCFDNLFLTER